MSEKIKDSERVSKIPVVPKTSEELKEFQEACGFSSLTETNKEGVTKHSEFLICIDEIGNSSFYNSQAEADADRGRRKNLWTQGKEDMKEQETECKITDWNKRTTEEKNCSLRIQRDQFFREQPGS